MPRFFRSVAALPVLVRPHRRAPVQWLSLSISARISTPGVLASLRATASLVARAVVLAAILFGSPHAIAQCGDWQVIHDDNPPASFGGAMAYDSARGRSVMLGSEVPPETWEWDGVLWDRRPDSPMANTSPQSRTGYAMAYDSLRGRTVVFGGIDFSDTWEWDGTAWTRHVNTGLPGRLDHAMAFDSVRGRVVLFGGVPAAGGGHPIDTWEWDGSAWTQRAATGPPGRTSHTVVYDSARGRIVLYGGGLGFGIHATYFSDTWEWDGETWTQRAVVGPPARGSHAMSYDGARQRVVVFGGFGTGPGYYLNDTWEWDGTSWEQRIVAAGPIPRWDVLMTYDSVRSRTVLYGGQNRSIGLLRDTWEWDGSVWVQRGPTEPPARPSPALVYDVDRERTLLFGGSGFGDTWTWDGAFWLLRSVSGPPGRSFHAMAYDSGRQRAVLFGGRDAEYVALGDTWEWDGTAWILRSTTGPAPRSGHAMAYDSARGRVLLFGGGGFSDTWEWDGNSWTERVVPGPSARYGHSITYDSVRRRVVLFGGVAVDSGTYPSAETWEWDGTAWTRGASLGPPANTWFNGRAYASMAYDAVRARTILFGGVGVSEFADVWEWDGVAWIRRTHYAGFVRARSPMAYDTSRSTMVLFGGDTLELPSEPAPPIILLNPTDQVVRAGEDVSQSVSAGGVGPFTYRWVRSGTTLVDGPGGASLGGGTVSGTTTATLAIAGVQPSDGGEYPGYFCIVSNACDSITTNGGSFIVLQPCGTADYDRDGTPGTESDIEAFFACLAGNCCPACPPNADFNGDGDVGTDLDIEAFFRVLGGGAC